MELEARHEIMLHSYILKIQIESRVAGDLAQNHIIPTAIAYQNRLIENVRGLRDVLSAERSQKACSIQVELIVEMSDHIRAIKTMVDQMVAERKKANLLLEMREKAIAYCEYVRPCLDTIRYHADKLELLVDETLATPENAGIAIYTLT